jgi:hypothetical protein
MKVHVSLATIIKVLSIVLTVLGTIHDETDHTA